MAVPAGYVLQQVLAPDLLSSFGRLKGAFVKQKVEVLEVVTGCETSNKYKGRRGGGASACRRRPCVGRAARLTDSSNRPRPPPSVPASTCRCRRGTRRWAP